MSQKDKAAEGERKLPENFEKAMDRLQEIVDLLETGKACLDDELKLYEEGVALITYCSDKLNAAEQKIREITSAEKNGEENA